MNAKILEVIKKHGDKDILGIIMENDKGMRAGISNYGGLIQSLIVPGRGGKPVDIVLGFDTIEDYFSEEYRSHYAYLGAIIGRYANRIKNGRFELDGQIIKLTKNRGLHQLHGGVSGFDKKVWEIVSIEEKPHPKVTLTYLSSNGEEGFPGNLYVNASYELNNNNELIFATEATTDQTTAVNLTQHSYFNLNGDGSTIGDHLVEIPASNYLAQDEDYVATGELIKVIGTAHDFTKAKPIKQDWTPGEGYDQSFVLDKDYRAWGRAATVYAPRTGIRLEVSTDQPTLHFYSGKYLDIKNGKTGKKYEPFTGFCLEAQHHANAVNIPSFPNTILRRGEIYQHKTSYRVSIE